MTEPGAQRRHLRGHESSSSHSGHSPSVATSTSSLPKTSTLTTSSQTLYTPTSISTPPAIFTPPPFSSSTTESGTNSETQLPHKLPPVTIPTVASSKTISGSSDLKPFFNTVSPTATISEKTSSTATPSFAWSNVSATVETCTTATLSWDYAGPQQTIRLFLLPIAAPPADAAAIQKRADNNSTISTGVDTAALQWTWSQVNASAGQYVVVALGDGIDAASPPLVITNGTDTSCLPTPEVSTISGQGAPSGGVLSGGIGGGVVGLIVAIGGCLVWKRSRRREPWSRLDSSRREHGLTSFIPSWVPRLANNCRHGHVLDGASHPPLISNWWQTSASLVAEPRTPEPLYTPYRQRHGQELAGESLEDVIESRFSTLSDVSAMSALAPSSPSTYLPSYTTSISTPPSYSTEAAGGVSRSPSANGSYENPR